MQVIQCACWQDNVMQDQMVRESVQNGTDKECVQDRGEEIFKEKRVYKKEKAMDGLT